MLRNKLDAMTAENKRNFDKWWAYEQEYILPCFKWADQCGINLRDLVDEAKGNSTVRFFGALQERLRIAEAERDALKTGRCLACHGFTVGLPYGHSCSCADQIHNVANRLDSALSLLGRVCDLGFDHEKDY